MSTSAQSSVRQLAIYKLDPQPTSTYLLNTIQSLALVPSWIGYWVSRLPNNSDDKFELPLRTRRLIIRPHST